jgi:hypothetical protein
MVQDRVDGSNLSSQEHKYQIRTHTLLDASKMGGGGLGVETDSKKRKQMFPHRHQNSNKKVANKLFSKNETNLKYFTRVYREVSGLSR